MAVDLEKAERLSNLLVGTHPTRLDRERLDEAGLMIRDLVKEVRDWREGAYFTVAARADLAHCPECHSVDYWDRAEDPHHCGKCGYQSPIVKRELEALPDLEQQLYDHEEQEDE